MWTLLDVCSGTRVVASGGSYTEPNGKEETTHKVRPTKLRFFVYDAGKDGIGGPGESEARVKVWFNGKIWIAWPGSFKEKREDTWGKCTEPPVDKSIPMFE